MPSDKERRELILDAIGKLPLGEVRLMEVCGTHTMSIAKSGIRAMLPKNVQLLSGPGCPVCVTPPAGAGAKAGDHHCKLRRYAESAGQRTGQQP